MKKEMKYCTNCLMPETRPRITFDEHGICNACQWAEEKKRHIDWDARKKELHYYCDKYRSQGGNFDCIIPVSGGKDSSYVSYMMKQEMEMHPLCINIAPPLEIDVGKQNLENFINAGYDCMRIFPDPGKTKQISRRMLIDYGQPLMSWIINVQVAIFKIAIKFDIPFVMFGEEGEVEYGGSSKLKHSAVYDIEDSIKLYLSGINPNQFKDYYKEKELYWWLYPSVEEFRKSGLAIAHWSYFENWDPYHHYLVSKEKVGLKENPMASVSTYNNFAQTDTYLYDLHTYLMYLKFGFGRCTQDVGIDIRRGAMSRKQGVQLVKMFDGVYPEPYIDTYLNYFEMSFEEFDATLDKHVNKDLFEKVDGRWVPIFEVK
jgi:N-acetyl sugar amidotransferase